MSLFLFGTVHCNISFGKSFKIVKTFMLFSLMPVTPFLLFVPGSSPLSAFFLFPALFHSRPSFHSKFCMTFQLSRNSMTEELVNDSHHNLGNDFVVKRAMFQIDGIHEGAAIPQTGSCVGDDVCP